MSDLFTWFQSYLNLAKLIAITVPGMVVAFALILVLGPVPCSDSKDCPFCPSSLKPAKTGGTARGRNATSGTSEDVEGYVTVSLTNLGNEQGLDAANQQIAVYNELVSGDPKKLLTSLAQAQVTGADSGSSTADGAQTSPDIKAPPKSEPSAAGKSSLRPKPSAAGQPSLHPKPSRGSDSLQSSKTSNDSQPSQDSVVASCANAPTFIASTKAVQYLAQKDQTKAEAAANKKGETLALLDDELKILSPCSNALQYLETQIGVQNAALQQLITQYTADLQSLSASYLVARQTGEQRVQADIDGQIAGKKKDLANTQQQTNALAAVKSTVDTLNKSVQGMLTSINTAPADAAPATPNAASDVFSAIEQNLMKFLLFSLIIGQILDPIQRGAMSFVGPRRNFFRSLNLVYGQTGDGEFRYGERRLLPWVENLGKIEPVTPANEAERRPNDADRRFGAGPANLRSLPKTAFAFHDRNIYDKNYAVGAGYITAKEASSIEDEYYGQSQITSGLILPMLILSICIAVRMICCSTPTTAPDPPDVPSFVWDNILLCLSTISFGICTGTGLMITALMLTSQRYWTAFASGGRAFFVQTRKFRDQQLASKQNKEPVHAQPACEQNDKAADKQADSSLTVWRFRAFILIAILLVLAWLATIIVMTFWFCPSTDVTNGLRNHLGWLDLMMIVAPTLLVGPLWITGLDRLHKFYSELGARIAGNILRLNTNTERKIVDIVTDPDARAKLHQSIVDAIKDKEMISAFFRGEKLPGDTEDGA